MSVNDDMLTKVGLDAAAGHLAVLLRERARQAPAIDAAIAAGLGGQPVLGSQAAAVAAGVQAAAPREGLEQAVDRSRAQTRCNICTSIPPRQSINQ